MNRKRAFLPVLHSCFIFLILVLLFPNLAYSFPADFDGDGKNDFVVWRQPEANWYVWPSTYSVSHSCPPHFQQISGTSYLGCIAQWGLPGDYVLSGNYDQDAKADLVIWRPSTQTWWIKFSLDSTAPIQHMESGTSAYKSALVVPLQAGSKMAGYLRFRRVESANWVVDFAYQNESIYDSDLVFALGVTELNFNSSGLQLGDASILFTLPEKEGFKNRNTIEVRIRGFRTSQQQPIAMVDIKNRGITECAGFSEIVSTAEVNGDRNSVPTWYSLEDAAQAMLADVPNQ